MYASKDLEVTFWGKNQIDLSHLNKPLVFASAPIELHIKEDGALDDSASLLFIMELSDGFLPAELTMNMLRSALKKNPEAMEIFMSQLQER